MTPLAWMILAGCLAIAEIFAPGAVLIWFAFGSTVASLAVWYHPDMIWPLQVAICLGSSIVSLMAWRLFANHHDRRDAASGINQRLQSLVGQIGTLEHPIQHGQGRVRLGDTTWTVRGPDLPKGQAVLIIGVDDGVLRCELATTQPGADEGSRIE